MKPIPLLFFGDSIGLFSGLGRITRDLAQQCAVMPEFRVGSAGMAGITNRKLPIAQYNFPQDDQWGSNVIRRIWDNFAGNEPGIIFTIWDASRLHWFSRPFQQEPDYEFLCSRRFSKWGYFPVDSTGPGGVLSGFSASTIAGYDRVLAYTIFGSEVLSKSLNLEVNWIPHGIDSSYFRPRDPVGARIAMGVNPKTLVIGMVATNQPRKDWGCAFSTIRLLLDKHPDLMFWAHTDTLQKDHGWDLQALVGDFGLKNHVKITFTGDLDDTALSYYYSACDLTILASSEGFGYPLVESMACGVPVLHVNYGGGAELIPERSWLIEPRAYRLEGLHNCVRPVTEPKDWAEAVERVLDQKVTREMCTAAVDHLHWERLFPATWKRWFLEGIGQ